MHAKPEKKIHKAEKRANCCFGFWMHLISFFLLLCKPQDMKWRPDKIKKGELKFRRRNSIVAKNINHREILRLFFRQRRSMNSRNESFWRVSCSISHFASRTIKVLLLWIEISLESVSLSSDVSVWSLIE